MKLLFLGIFVVVSVGLLGLASAHDVQLVTSKGNIINFEHSHVEQPDDGILPENIGTGNGSSTIDGMGVKSRIIQTEDEGVINHGVWALGTEKSIKPYVNVPGNTRFAATILDSNIKQTYYIPEFFKTYRLDGNALVDITQNQNTLGYSQARNLVGHNNIRIDNGIVVSGSGEMLIKLNNLTGKRIILKGELGDSMVKLVTPIVPINLMTAPYGGKGFAISNSFPTPAGKDTMHRGVLSWTETWTQMSQTCECTGDYFRGKCLQWSAPMTFIHHSRDLTMNLSLIERDNGDHVLITGTSSDPPTPPGIDIHSAWNGTCQRYLSNGIMNGTITNQVTTIYDTLPAETVLEYSESFTSNNMVLEGEAYLYVKPNGGTVTISVNDISGEYALKINDLPPNMPFQIVTNDITAYSGMTYSNGFMFVRNVIDSSKFANGSTLHLYPDSLSHRGSFSTVVFDHVNDRMIHIDTPEDKVYVTHAWVQIPVTDDIEISDLNLDETLDIDYLNGDYSSGDYIRVPVIPGYKTIHLTINDQDAQISYADVLGGTGIKIIKEASNTMSKVDDRAIRSIESTAGSTAYAIATTDGTISAIISATISGTAEVSNKLTLERDPTPPPPPPRRDPLTAWVDMYVNGDLYAQKQMYFDDTPEATLDGRVRETSSIQTATYQYDQTVVSTAVSVDVEPGDFVEFYVYSKIHADGIAKQNAPSGFREIGFRSTGTATANIHGGYIQTSM